MGLLAKRGTSAAVWPRCGLRMLCGMGMPFVGLARSFGIVLRLWLVLVMGKLHS